MCFVLMVIHTFFYIAFLAEMNGILSFLRITERYGGSVCE